MSQDDDFLHVDPDSTMAVQPSYGGATVDQEGTCYFYNDDGESTFMFRLTDIYGKPVRFGAGTPYILMMALVRAYAHDPRFVEQLRAMGLQLSTTEP